MGIELLHIDCMEYMQGLPDNAFDLAIVDPPYGIERFQKPAGNTRFHSSKELQLTGLKWDKKPDEAYFKELFRVSEFQIVWGANNFVLPASEYFVVWDKQQTVDNFASAELAYTNKPLPAKVFRYSIHRHNKIKDKIHPTQKPIALYKWLLKNYAEPGQRILDTHLGSGSSAIAAHQMGFDFVGCELDEDYFKASMTRFKRITSQLQMAI